MNYLTMQPVSGKVFIREKSSAETEFADFSAQEVSLP